MKSTVRSARPAPVRSPAPEPDVGAPPLARPGRRAVGLAALLAALAVAALLSLALGSHPLSIPEAWHGLWARDGSEAANIVWGLRGPRTLGGLVVGAAFGVAGALIQALTRNPLADPGILGVNAGAGFAVTLGVGAFGLTGVTGYIWYAFVGAAAATLIGYLIGGAGRGSASPVALVLAGVALGAVLSGFSSMLALLDPETFVAVRNWGVGQIADTDLLDQTMSVAPFLFAGLLLAGLLGGPLNSLALGDDLAATLGTKVASTRTLTVVAITLLAGSATALTGGIAFVGLMVPHVARWFTGPDQRWIIAYSALGGATLVLLADVAGRVAGRPGEIEVGIVTAVIGAPVLIALVRRRAVSGL